MPQQKATSWIIKHSKEMRPKIVFLTFINVVLGLTAIFFAFYSRETVDAAFNQNQDDFIFYAILISSIMLLNILFLALNHYLKVIYQTKIDQYLKNKMFKKIMKADFIETSNLHSGTLLTHLESDTIHVSDGIVDIIPKFVFYLVRFGGAFILLFLIDAWFALLFIALGVLLFIGSRILSKPIKSRHHKLQSSIEIARSYRQEAIENITVIKSFEAEEKIAELQNAHQEEVFKKTKFKHQLSVFVSSGSNLFFSFGYAFAIIFGAYRLQTGLSIGSLIAMIQLVSHIQSPFSGISMLIPKYYQMISSSERLMKIDEFHEEKKSDLDIYKNTLKKLEVHNLSFSYIDEKEVIKHLSFELKPGEMIHLVGDSGKGKTTLFKLLLGLIRPKEGSITLDLGDQRYNAGNETRACFSYVPQEFFILSGTIRDNLNLYLTHSDEKIKEALKISAVYEDIMNLPLALDTVLGERGKGLSEGQIQRLAIARALLKDAPILLLDEITSALDLDTENLIMKHIKEMTDKACIIISHRPIQPEIITFKIEL